MMNFRIDFSYPWLLLLLIPAIALTLIPYFRLTKKYRKTRNRITSMTLHILIMVFAVSILSGMMFLYQVPNKENEILLLVDVSETEERVREERDSFIQTVLSDGQYDHYKMGIVTFGFDQRYAVPLTYETDKIYDAYLQAETPDTTATNVAAALTYAKGLFEYPDSAKIVLITDGKETDQSADSVIRAIAAQGTRVDTAYVASDFDGNDAQISAVTLPDYHVNVNEECSVGITVQSKVATYGTIEIFDNGEKSETLGETTVALNKGTQTVYCKHVFRKEGFHELQVRLSVEGDEIEENDRYYACIDLEVFNKILIIESEAESSDGIKDMLNTEEEVGYEIVVKNVYTDRLPETLDELRSYDQIILNNISNADINSTKNANVPTDFDVMLEKFVSEYGGGLFTVGGSDEFGDAHAYNEDDLYGTLYQQMLPVQAISYTPPVGVMVLVDNSGSMGSADEHGETSIAWAKAGATACLAALDERDYIGIMTFDDSPEIMIEPTARSKEKEILAAINRIQDDYSGGQTIFAGAITSAAGLLRSVPNVSKRHIVIVTDGAPTESASVYEEIIEKNYKMDRITVSVIAIGFQEGSSSYLKMKSATDKGGGRVVVASNQELPQKMYDELMAPEITSVNIPEGGFAPIIKNTFSPLVQNVETGEGENANKLTVKLMGFYGVKAKNAADVVLVGDYEVPVYAQWKYGKGMVGSFMCDLNGVWSADFMANVNGKRFVQNVVNNLMPTVSLRPSQINIGLETDNYTNKLSVYASLEEGERIEGKIVALSEETETAVSLNGAAETQNEFCYLTSALSASNYYSRCNFVVKKGGVYRIELSKIDQNGTVLATYQAYKTFSYSEEYDTFFAENTELVPEESLKNLASRGDGASIADLEDPWEVFDGFVTALDRSFDPRFLFAILAIVCFLADIAARKFKFKWLHEVVREYREKKNSK